MAAPSPTVSLPEPLVTGFNKASKNALYLVKSTNVFISEFVGGTSDPCWTNGLMLGAPYIHKTGNSFFFDYSGVVNSSDLKFLKKFFGSLTGGSTFAIDSGTYYKESTGDRYDITGVYTIIGYTGPYNNYIRASGVSYSASLFNGVYENKQFSDIPQYSTNKTGTASYYFVSKLNKADPLNLNYLGVYGYEYGYDEFIEVPESSLNNGRYLIDNFVKLRDGSEVIYINKDVGLVSQSLYGTRATVNIYMRGVPDINTLAVPTTVKGIVRKIDESGNIVAIFDNQNLRQRYCRSDNDDDHYYDWYGVNKTSNLENIYNPYAYDGLSVTINYYSFVKIGSATVTLSEFTADGVFVDTVESNNVLIVDGVQTTSVSYSDTTTLSNAVLKIDLSDASLYNSLVVPYIDAECTIPLTNSFYMIGIPGYAGAFFMFLKELSSPPTFYIKFTRDTELVLKVTV